MKKYLLFGKPFSNAVAHAQRLRKLKALPILSSDALSSVAYGTEEILRVLVIGGVAALTLSVPIAIAICVLLFLLGASYFQTIEAYPNGGGAFTVAKDNLGVLPSLFAGAALLIDYLLTVAVSVSAGVHAITSAAPQLIPYNVVLCVITIIVMAWLNIRGAQESATIFAYPTYFFVVLILSLLSLGLVKVHLYPELIHPSIPLLPQHHPAGFDTGTVALSAYMILRAFSAGCSALTGVEGISNAVPLFKKPEVANAQTTLLCMIVLLGLMFFGVSYLATAFHILPEDSQTVLSQLGRHVFGNGFAYYMLQAATTAILFLAANTAFTGFPRLASILSHHKYLPKQFSSLGDRLSFSNGIASLAGFSCLLVIAFHGNTHHLIPLYAVGVFLAFSLSQAGMVKFWIVKRRPKWQIKCIINALGCFATTTALIVIIESKFFAGAWMTVILILGAPLLFFAVHKHYKAVDFELSVKVDEANQYLQAMASVKPKVIVPISRIHRGTLAALNFAGHIGDDVTAVTVEIEPKRTEKLRAVWSQLHTNIPLVVLPSPYRETITPLRRFIKEQDSRDPERGLCMIVMPEAVPTRWWHYLLHNQRAPLLKAALFLNRKYKGSTRVFVDVPYQLKR